ncbi:hypothetical protein F2Q69_00008044 [Brassica cretica]|uniref:Uncharacterized protein n=1 Tax=Brassica cretica TaxID=69181 RepID=A0A8S9PEF1_BRACR|nr:hypothetical protein F2Q69_00008044 [Brassica cretica]
MVAQRPLLVEQLNLVSKIHDQLYKVVRIVDVNSSEELDLSESFFMPKEIEMEENVRASLAGMESIFELTKVVSGKTQSLVEEKSHELKNLNETVGDGLRDVGVDFRSTKPLKDGKVQDTRDDSTVDHSTEENEIYSLLHVLKEELEEAKQAIKESEKKLKFKEETAAAAMGARDSAERSLKLAQ